MKHKFYSDVFIPNVWNVPIRLDKMIRNDPPESAAEGGLAARGVRREGVQFQTEATLEMLSRVD